MTGMIPIRVMRDGKAISAFPSELQYLTDAEIYSLPNPVSEALLKGLQRSNIWYRCNYSFAWFQAA